MFTIDHFFTSEDLRSDLPSCTGVVSRHGDTEARQRHMRALDCCLPLVGPAGSASRSPDTMCVDRTPIVQVLLGGRYGARYDAVNVREGGSVLSVMPTVSH
jgi:hypothetical protein